MINRIVSQLFTDDETQMSKYFRYAVLHVVFPHCVAFPRGVIKKRFAVHLQHSEAGNEWKTVVVGIQKMNLRYGMKLHPFLSQELIRHSLILPLISLVQGYLSNGSFELVISEEKLQNLHALHSLLHQQLEQKVPRKVRQQNPYPLVTFPYKTNDAIRCFFAQIELKDPYTFNYPVGIRIIEDRVQLGRWPAATTRDGSRLPSFWKGLTNELRNEKVFQKFLIRPVGVTEKIGENGEK